MPNLDDLSAETLAAVRHSIISRDPSRRREAVLRSLCRLWAEAAQGGGEPNVRAVAERAGLSVSETGSTLRQLVESGDVVASGKTNTRTFVPRQLYEAAMEAHDQAEGSRAKRMARAGARKVRGRRR